MERQFKELLRRRMNNDMGSVDNKHNSMEELFSREDLLSNVAEKDAPVAAYSNFSASFEPSHRPVSAILSAGQKKKLIQFAMPSNLNMRFA